MLDAECVCNAGFEGDGVDNCEDINECDVDPTVCGDDVVCCNLYGKKSLFLKFFLILFKKVISSASVLAATSTSNRPKHASTSTNARRARTRATTVKTVSTRTASTSAPAAPKTAALCLPTSESKCDFLASNQNRTIRKFLINNFCCCKYQIHRNSIYFLMMNRNQEQILLMSWAARNEEAVGMEIFYERINRKTENDQNIKK